MKDLTASCSSLWPRLRTCLRRISANKIIGSLICQAEGIHQHPNYTTADHTLKNTLVPENDQGIKNTFVLANERLCTFIHLLIIDSAGE